MQHGADFPLISGMAEFESQFWYVEVKKRKIRIDWSVDQFCTSCNRKMRGSKDPADGVTVKHASGTVCALCYRIFREKGIPIPDFRMDVTQTSDVQTCIRCKLDLPYREFSKSKGIFEKVCKVCHRATAYGIDREIFDKEMERLSYGCAICKKKFTYVDNLRPEIDHCHDSGKFRSILCGPCNRALGLIQDDIQVILSAMDYLVKGAIEIPLDYRYRPKWRGEERMCVGCGEYKGPDSYRNWSNGRGKNTTCIRCEDLIRCYNISSKQYSDLLESQGSTCAICNKSESTKRLAVDHDHSCCPNKYTCGDCIRGLLCKMCNLMLGTIDDSLSMLEDMVTYLKYHTNDKLLGRNDSTLLRTTSPLP